MAFHEPKPLLIFPYNGNGMEAVDCIDNTYQFLGFIDDAKEKQGTDPRGYNIFDRTALQNLPDARVLAVPGSPTSYQCRKQIINGLGISEPRFASLIHRAAIVSALAELGHNVLIMAGVVITSNAVIGNHVCILPNTVIHHDAVIGDWSLIGANVTIAGHTRIGENCYIGSGSSIMNRLEVGAGALIGLGSNVIRSVSAGGKVAGNPAKQIRRSTR
jgi:sugar O-acyltransferase (sialic acid O-acetyltransferase NeuD family)